MPRDHLDDDYDTHRGGHHYRPPLRGDRQNGEHSDHGDETQDRVPLHENETLDA